MMRHKDIERLIQRKLDGDLSPSDSARLNKHLAQCSDCTSFYREITQTTNLVRQLHEFHPSAGFNARVLAGLGVRRRFAWSKTGIALAGGWIAALVFFCYSSFPTQILGWLTTSFPSIVRFMDKVELVGESFSQVLTPVLKNAWSNANPVIGLVFSILFVYFLGKALQKEEKCKA
ncbi:MAG: zf-HC2 domain-containing protein [candidate division WOR-3 bacterium]|nr:MAG: zf-HC2 domain-containing protein [candidate division WOR-3 bacterium]